MVDVEAMFLLRHCLSSHNKTLRFHKAGARVHTNRVKRARNRWTAITPAGDCIGCFFLPVDQVFFREVESE